MKTAIQWLYGRVLYDQTIMAYTPERWMEIYQEALEMERQQIIDAYCDGSNIRTSGEEYYDEAYTIKNK